MDSVGVHCGLKVKLDVRNRRFSYRVTAWMCSCVCSSPFGGGASDGLHPSRFADRRRLRLGFGKLVMLSHARWKRGVTMPNIGRSAHPKALTPKAPLFPEHPCIPLTSLFTIDTAAACTAFPGKGRRLQEMADARPVLEGSGGFGELVSCEPFVALQNLLATPKLLWMSL